MPRFFLQAQGLPPYLIHLLELGLDVHQLPDGALHDDVIPMNDGSYVARFHGDGHKGWPSPLRILTILSILCTRAPNSVQHLAFRT